VCVCLSDMAPYYVQVAEELGWKVDSGLLEKMQKGTGEIYFFFFLFFFLISQNKFASIQPTLSS